MAKLRPLAVSAVVHAAVVAWAATRALTPVRAATEPVTVTPIEIVGVAPALAAPALESRDVARLEEHPPAADHSTPIRPPRSSVAPRLDASTERPAASADAGRPAESSPGRASLLNMRRGEAPRLALPAGRWNDLDRVPAGTGPEKSLTTGILHDSGGGTYSSDQGGFTGKVKPDGTVTLRDNPSASIHVALPTLKDLGHSLADWYEAEKGPFGETPEAPMRKQIQLSAGTTTDPGDEAHPEHYLKDSAKTVIIPVFAGRLELTDWLMRRKGIDPYASRKLKLLDDTRDERVQIGSRHRAERLTMTPQLVQRNLDRLWATTPDPAARKQALFELWDECVESGDPAAVSAGEAARRLVIAFIRAHLPAGGPDAFTPAELAALARIRHSKIAFAPYE